ncbi:MAG: hypothetical protein HGA25_04995, partial [Clostridiales bacterium]|nr:hypothetical protein [Clostridiales bacterium]
MLGSGKGKKEKKLSEDSREAPKAGKKYNTSTDYSRNRSHELILKPKEMLIDNPDFFCELRGDKPKSGEYRIFIIESALKT